MIRDEADTDATLRKDINFLMWAKGENRGDEAALRALVDKVGESVSGRQSRIVASLLDRDSWKVSDETFKAILLGDANDAQSGPIHVNERLATYAQLFPADSVSVTALRDLESWFRADRSRSERRDWDDTLAIAFGSADSQDLPAIVARAHARIGMGMSDLYLTMFTKPLVRRLRVDPDAVEALRVALSDPMGIREDSPVFAGLWDPISDACLDLHPLQRTYVFAVVLREVGALPQRDVIEVSERLTSASPDTIVHNPFNNHEGPLCLAALDLHAH